MTRPRDRQSSRGLLPRMESIPRKSGFTYRYHPIGGNPINLGHDRDVAIRKVLDLNGDNSDRGTLNEIWRLYKKSSEWNQLSESTWADYTQSSKSLLSRLGEMAPCSIKPSHIARYLRVERAAAPIRANREFSLLSNLLSYAVEIGELELNPCRQIRRNKEKPRRNAPSPTTLATFLEWAWSQTGQAPILAGMAEFASLAGNRGVEFRELTWPQVGELTTRLIRAKQRGGDLEQIVEEVEMSTMLLKLMERIRGRAKDTRHGYVFPNALGNAYSAQAFKLGFARLKAKARKAGMLDKNFTFHDLRSFYVTQYKQRHGDLPNLHANPATTARIYDSSKTVKRKSL